MSDQSSDDWQRELTNVTPLKSRAKKKVLRVKPGANTSKKPPSPAVPQVSASLLNLKYLSAGDFSDIDAGTIRRLKRGQLEIEGRMDLHGMKLHEADIALEKFIQKQVAYGHKLVLIITGKGSLSNPSTIRQSLTNWLNAPRLRPYVIAHTRAHPNHGGDGAFYVVLRKQKL